MLTAPELFALKASARNLVLHSGGQEACAAVPGMRIDRHQSFSEYGNAAHVDRHMPLDVVATLERFAGEPVVTRELARLSGYMLWPIEAKGGLLAVELGGVAREVGDVMAKVGGALGDGKISAAEARDIATEIHEAMQKLAALAEAVKSEAERDAE